MTQQTTENLQPYIKVQEFLQDEPSSSLSDNIFVIGHTSLEEIVPANDYAINDRVIQTGKIYVNIQATSGANNDPATDTAYWTYTGIDAYTPIDVGQITSVSTATSVCNKLGLKYKFTSSTELDVTQTDELAYTLIKGALFYSSYSPSKPRFTLSPLNYTVSLLGTTTQNTKISNPFGDGTINVFTNATSHSLQADVICHPYEYATGDAALGGNYFEEVKTYCESTNNEGDPTRGNNFTFFADISSTVASLPAALDDTGFMRSANILYPNSKSSVTAPSLVAIVAIIYQGVSQPFSTVIGEIIPNLALPEINEIVGKDLRASCLQYGWSPLVANNQLGTVSFSRILSASILNPITGIPRDNSIDAQDFRIDFYARNLVYRRIIAGDIENTRYTVNAQGNIAVAQEIIDIMIAVDTQLYIDQMIAVSPKNYVAEYKVRIDKDSPNRVIASKPIYTAASIAQIDVSQTSKGFIPLIVNLTA